MIVHCHAMKSTINTQHKSSVTRQKMSNIGELSDSVIMNVRKVLKCTVTVDEINKWVKYINKIINLLTKAIKSKISNSGNFRK